MKKTREHSHSAPQTKNSSTKFSTQFLTGAVLVLGVLSLLGSYIMGYQFGQMSLLSGDQPLAPTPVQAAAAAPQPQAAPSLPPPPSVPKQARPEVELFVMSECPFGLQMEKAFVPVAKLLGSKADMNVKWVSYAMHGLEEVEENTRQYCIQEEQEGKYLAYLECYIETKNPASCEAAAGIDSGKLTSCVQQANVEHGIMDDYNDRTTWLSGQFPIYAVHEDLNQAYGVQGSPTLVINGQQVSVMRSAEAVKQAICNAFENPPDECGETLNSNQEQAGHGPLGVGTAPGAAGLPPGCGV